MDVLVITQLCKAFVDLMEPLVEIVIHDMQKGIIYSKYGNLSKRSVGDLSLLTQDEMEKDIHKIIYPKINFDGRLIRSISVPLGENFIACINCDVSIFSQMQLLAEQLLSHSQTKQPESFFKNDWQEQLHKNLHTYLIERNLNFQNLTNSQKKEVIHCLFLAGAFNQKNSVDYVAKILDMGRATIFKYLKEWRIK